MRKIAVITGASKGIGSAIALAYAQNGYDVALLARNSFTLHEGAQAIKRQVPEARVEIFPCDVGCSEEVRRTFLEIRRLLGRPQVLVNNAGISPVRDGKRTPFYDIELPEWDSVLRINLSGAFFCSRMMVALREAEDGGSIINIASAAARTGGMAAGAHYVASKAGLIGLTKVMARDLGEFGIRVNAIAPGRIVTSMLSDVSIPDDWAQNNTLLKRLGEPADIAGVAVFLSSDAARYMTGATIDVNGGWVLY